jgi:DNA-binding MarR family transcriptional regulator/N-acetylglutamate synthase-like GNAT family acetyltransferase
MVEDVIGQGGYLFLGSRLKRLGERLQADVLRVIETETLPVQPSQAPLLTALDRHGPLTVGAMVEAVGLSQPAVTRTVANLVDAGLVEISRAHRDQRQKTISLTPAGRLAMANFKARVWPRIEAAVTGLCDGLSGSILDQLAGIEAGLAVRSLGERAPAPPPGLTIRPFSDELAPAFHDINAEWIEAMFRLEPTDREVLENPRDRILAPGGDILFVEAAGLGVVGACALQKTGERQFELTKMGVRDSARGRKAGEFLLAATIRRAQEIGADTLYLLTNSKCAPAIHLYEKLGFAHDEGIMRDFGARYERCDVAMRYRGSSSSRGLRP